MYKRQVRLRVNLNGAFSLEVEPLERGVLPQPVRVGLAREPVDSGRIWLYHKATRREIYDAARATRPDCDEVILWNERGELTEACTANVVLEDRAGDWVTPPVTVSYTHLDVYKRQSVDHDGPKKTKIAADFLYDRAIPLS